MAAQRSLLDYLDCQHSVVKRRKLKQSEKDPDSQKEKKTMEICTTKTGSESLGESVQLEATDHKQSVDQQDESESCSQHEDIVDLDVRICPYECCQM